MTAQEILAAIAPEFASIDPSGALTIADKQIAPNLGGDQRPMLIAYLAAHILTIANKHNGATGAMSSISEGNVTATYITAGSKVKSSGLSTTSYGQEYDRLSRACVFAAVTCGNNYV